MEPEGESVVACARGGWAPGNHCESTVVAGAFPLHRRDDLEHEFIVGHTRHPGSVAGGADLNTK